MIIRSKLSNLLRLSLTCTILIPLLICLKPADAASLTGQVMAVNSGTQLTVMLPDKHLKAVELLGIRTSPVNTLEGNDARKHLNMLVGGKPVQVEYHTLTPQGAVLGVVRVGGSEINLRLLQTGLAVVDSQPGLDEAKLREYQEAEGRARVQGLGLWNKQPARGR